MPPLHAYEYPRPALTVDAVCSRVTPGKGVEVLLIRRGKMPFRGAWALPGGFVNEGEETCDAAVRELKEETGIEARYAVLAGVFSKPGRDPRGWTVSVAYKMVDCTGEAKGADDAAEAGWWPLWSLPDMAFDHEEIIRATIGA